MYRTVGESLGSSRAAAWLSRSSRHRVRREEVTKRLDIQGLRAVAVVAVVLNHLTNQPKGGFVGVDVFFVISGYLITRRLVRMLGTRSAHTYLWDFYKLRIRRILPAALVVIAVTIAASHLTFGAARAHQTLIDGGWAAIFGANWHFAAIGTNYFASARPVSPFQHYWSLAVEEQFYIAWPIVLLVIGWLIATLSRTDERRQVVQRGATAVAAIVLSGVSFWWGFKQSTADPTTAYFSTFTRVWELGVGALLACAVPRLPKMSRLVATAISWTGLAMIVVACFVISGGSGFPVPGAILPVAGSAIVILGGAVAPPMNAALTNRLSVFLGDISYSVYLVHFPVIIILGAYMPSKGAYYYMAVVGLSLGLAMMCWAWVEEPIRNSMLLLTSDDPRREPTESARSHIALWGSALVVAGFAVVSLWPGDLVVTAAEQSKVLSALSQQQPVNPLIETDAQLTAPEKAISAQIATALRATSWPTNLTPTVQSALSAGGTDACGAPSQVLCEPNPHAPASALIIGDSLAARLAQAAWAGLHNQYDVVTDGLAGCPAVPVNVTFPSAGAKATCLQHRAAVLGQIKRTRPSLLMITDDYGDSERLPHDGTQPTRWETALTSLIDSVKPYVKRVVVVTPTPAIVSLAVCTEGTDNSPVPCISQPSGLWFDVLGAEQQATRATKVGFINTFRWYCDQSAYCPPFVGNTLVRMDNVHMTGQYAYKISGLLSAALAGSR